MGPQAPSASAKTSNKPFMINWDGVRIDYDFASKKSIVGIILLEVQSARELPKVKNRTSTSLMTLTPAQMWRTILSDSHRF
jgi:hypothetical protein